MMGRKWRRLVAVAGILGLLGLVAPAGAQPVDPSPIDCAGPAGEADPGTPGWFARDAANIYCAQERHLDKALHPVTAAPASGPINDAYREPSRHDGVRFRFDTATIGNLDAEVYRPCAEGACPGLSAELQAHEPPYPAVIVLHGGGSRKELHWWSSQSLAEAGYLVVAFDGANVATGRAVLDWLHDGEDPLTADFDGALVGIAGHSIGGDAAAQLAHTDPRISSVVYWDRAGLSSPRQEDLTVPSLVLMGDYGCPAPLVCPPEARADYPDPADRGAKTQDFGLLRDTGIDTMQVALRAVMHFDWVPSELAGNRYGEILNVYYTRAWFDRYLKGLADPDVAADAFRRLTARVFDDSADRHNISQGFFDPAQAVASGDPLYGGNVPYTLDGMPVADRLSFYYDSKCSLTVPGGGQATSDDVRAQGCPAEGGEPEPEDPQPATLDCEGPAGDPEPGTPGWRARDAANMLCAQQRHVDKAQHPGLGGERAFFDAYRVPERHDGVRFRYDLITIAGLDAEVYRPCAAGACPDLPDGLRTFEPPYPAVVSLHGGASRRELHWWSSQSLAEAGYLVVTIDAAGLAPTAAEALAVVDWLFAGDHALAAEFDGERVGIAGHSAGGVVASRLGQEDDRISAVVSWDRAQSSQMPPGLVIDTPALFFFADYNCQAVPVCQPHPYEAPPTPDGPGNKGEDFLRVRDAGIDTMQIALRAATHLDWVPTLLSGNRYGEIMSVYYTLAWFDRYLRGTADHEVAADAFRRLTADVFGDSADRHNISQGFFDPLQAALATDPYGGNVPYTLGGTPVADRLSFYYLSKCFVSAPGTSGARASSDDMRTNGCAAPDDPGDAAVSVACVDCEIQVRAGESGQARVAVTNVGAATAAVGLTAVAPSGWTATVTPAEVVLQSGESATVVVHVDVPRSAKGSHLVEVTATADNGTTSTDHITIEAVKGPPSNARPSPD